MSTSNSGTPLKNPEQEMLHCHKFITPPKTNMDTQNYGLEEVAHSKKGHFGIYVDFFGGTPHFSENPTNFETSPKSPKFYNLMTYMSFEYITISLVEQTKTSFLNLQVPFEGDVFQELPLARDHPEKKSLDSCGRTANSN